MLVLSWTQVDMETWWKERQKNHPRGAQRAGEFWFVTSFRHPRSSGGFVGPNATRRSWMGRPQWPQGLLLHLVLSWLQAAWHKAPWTPPPAPWIPWNRSCFTWCSHPGLLPVHSWANNLWTLLFIFLSLFPPVLVILSPPGFFSI